MPAESSTASRGDALSAVDYLVIQLPSAPEVDADLAELLGLVDKGVIGVLDAEFVANDDGRCRVMTTAEASQRLGVDVAAWDGASSGLLQPDDLEELATAVEPGAVAFVLVYENRWLSGLVGRWGRHGVRIVAEGEVAVADMVAALDAGDTN